MVAEKQVDLFDLKEWSDLNNGLGLITKLQNFGILPIEQKCLRAHFMKLAKDQSTIDNFKWVCRKKNWW